MRESRIFQLGGEYYEYRVAPHLKSGVDWHDAYIAIVAEALEARSSEYCPTPVPKYPLVSDIPPEELLFEMGSYWEGALYYLCRVLRDRDPLQGVRRLEAEMVGRNLSPRDGLFLKIWNNYGQLKWLKAYLIRELALEQGVVEASHDISSSDFKAAGEAGRDENYTWLAHFIDQHREEGQKYPNPYFGGTNPLHLGIILSMFEDD